ncbi:MAG: hypothetical protein ACR2LT_00320 [Pyrinomonadaceae bacterium]
MKKLAMYISILTMVLLFASVNLTAQTRIKFKRGRNSATVSGTLAPSGARTYVLRARRGQNVTATLSSANGKIDFTQRAVHDTQFNETVDESGDVRIMIDNHGGRTRYTLTVSIQ